MMQSRKSFVVTDEHWIPLSDLMSGLMMVFMLLAVLFTLEVEEKTSAAQANAERMTRQAEQITRQAKHIQKLSLVHQSTRQSLQFGLQREFSKDLAAWRAEIDQDLTVRFTQPDVLFQTGSAVMSQSFERILADFFPRYVELLQKEPFKSSITEIRLEGHTSSTWAGAPSNTEAYLSNMELSQARTRNVLAFVLTLQWPDQTRAWLIANLTANGLSSSKPILNAQGQEDQARSQRVEFRIRTKSLAVQDLN